ncbi:hypothetical protein BPMI_04312 [Candidatus Burkholderia pumila]|uniref:Uncharacterized protein n=1 Tax=Candidatus Burkholderia pumila TaxID=1090375 RepID=A0ABR5HMU9_9BURK|nr:hypothetical protein BPMI_04312 [Candidatus Burkholderia pumila]
MTMNSDPAGPRDERPVDPTQPGVEHFDAGITHVDESYAAGAAKGILYSIIETLGTLVGGPDLPSHTSSGYEDMIETAQELRAKIEQ